MVQGRKRKEGEFGYEAVGARIQKAREETGPMRRISPDEQHWNSYYGRQRFVVGNWIEWRGPSWPRIQPKSLQ
jgi:hypothetical protein